MTGEELQQDIFNYRLQADGVVSFAELPSIAQLNMLLYINPANNYFIYTPEKAMDDILLYYRYNQNRRRKNEFNHE